MPDKPLSIAFGSQSLKLKLDAIELPCYILENGLYVFPKDGIQKAMGYEGKSKNWLFEFLSHIGRLAKVNADFLEALSQNTLFEIASLKGDRIIAQGIAPDLLIEACKTIVNAKNDGFLFVSELKFAKAAETILKNIADKDVYKRIDYATGFDLYKQNHKAFLFRAMKAKFDEEYFVWAKTFSDAFFEVFFKFKEWQWADLNNKADEATDFIQEIIFSRLDNALLAELNNAKPRMKYRKENSPEEYLEHPKLQEYLQSVLAFMKASEGNDYIFMNLLNRSYPKQNEKTPLYPKEHDETESSKFSLLNQALKKAAKSSRKT